MSTTSPTASPGQIAFADDLVPGILNGQKGATVRYGGYESVQVGDTLTATTTDGEPFATLKIRRTATVLAVEVHGVLEVIGADYASECPRDVIDQLNTYYDGQIRPGTHVRVLVFEVVDIDATVPEMREHGSAVFEGGETA